MLTTSVILIIECVKMISSIEIVKILPSSSVMVEEGGTVSLSCQADRRWFLCLWKSPSGNKVCAIQESEEGASKVCQGHPRIVVQGEYNNCGVTISNISRQDWGDWLCLVQDGEKFLTDRQVVGVEVARRGRVWLEFGGEESNNTDDIGVLRIEEGSLANLSCTSEAAYPPPRISWHGLNQGDVRKGRYVDGLREDDQLYGNISIVEEVRHYATLNLF